MANHRHEPRECRTTAMPARVPASPYASKGGLGPTIVTTQPTEKITPTDQADDHTCRSLTTSIRPPTIPWAGMDDRDLSKPRRPHRDLDDRLGPFRAGLVERDRPGRSRPLLAPRAECVTPIAHDSKSTRPRNDGDRRASGTDPTSGRDQSGSPGPLRTGPGATRCDRSPILRNSPWGRRGGVLGGIGLEHERTGARDQPDVHAPTLIAGFREFPLANVTVIVTGIVRIRPG